MTSLRRAPPCRHARRLLAIARHALLATLAAIPSVHAAPATDPAADPDAACPPVAVPLSAERFRAGLRQADDHGFLWRIVKDGHTSYLYGTIHAARPEWMFPGPRTAAALAASDTLALELDVLDADIQARLAASALARPGETLPPELERRIALRMTVECVDPAPWHAFAPEFQIASLAVLAARRQGFDPAYAIDLVLALLARDRGKPTVSLESPEAQMAALRLPTRAATIEFVESGLDDLESGRAGPLLARMARAWTDRDFAELEGYERWCECLRNDGERAAMKRLLDDRNPALAAAIDALHQRGQRIFAAVGSLHMIGPGGLPTLLAQRGYRVEPVRFTP
jgi:uncharacterized protein YbaP (TraB family)